MSGADVEGPLDEDGARQACPPAGVRDGWARLGLVTVDVASLTVSGLTDGQHVEPKMNLGVSAADNQGAGIKQMERDYTLI